MKAIALSVALVLVPFPAYPQQTIPEKVLEDLKAAIVFVSVRSAFGVSSGSGFVIKTEQRTGYVVTNAHVVAPRGQPAQVTCIFHSGTKAEQVVEVSHAILDGDRDLAILKVEADRLPAPIDLSKRPKIRETLPVFILGFPFGERLATTRAFPAITISRGSVSSIRKDDQGRTVAVQIDGDVNPGNSGGPVVDSRGNLIGIAVAKLAGTQINFAIPPEELSALLAGLGDLINRTTRQSESKPEINALSTRGAVHQLPSAVSDVAVGGSGRYLILLLPKDRQLAIFDAMQAKIVRYVSVPEDTVKITAGQDALIVALPGAKAFMRYSLTTFEREQLIPFSFKGTIRSICMGCASEGPLLIHVKEDQGSGIQVNLPRFLDPRTFRPIEAQVDPQRAASGGFDYRTEFRASPDGQTFAMWHLDVAPHGLQTIQVGRNAMALKNEHSDAGYLVPGCDGRVLFTQLGLYSLEQLKPLQEDPRRRQSVLPAHSGNFYVTFAREESKPVLNIAVLGDEQPLIQLRDIDGFTTANSSTGLHDLLGNRPGYNPYYPSDPFGSEAPWNDSFSTDKRFHLMPEAKLIVLIPTSNDRLVLHRFDIEEALEKSGREFLVVVSQSPAAAYKGTSYRYPIRVKSKRGGVKYKLEAGPTAMSVSRDGTITWQVPAGFVEAETNVMVSIRDAAGQERLHSFTLPVREAAAADNRNPAKQASSKPDINLPEIDDVKEEKGSPDEPKQQTPTDKLKREATAKGKLKLAQQLLDKKRVEAAKKYLRDIVEHYPDTEAAGEARRLLEHLKSPE